MPQSLSRVIIHLVFSTRDRHPYLDPEINPRIHAYLATLCRDEDCEAYRVGGVADHVHLAVRLGRTASQSKLVENLKKKSSGWIKRQNEKYTKFYWQKGYGAFSVSPQYLDDLLRYIDGQEEHQRKESFQDEYRRFLAKYEMEYDERYVWD